MFDVRCERKLRQTGDLVISTCVTVCGAEGDVSCF